MKRINKWSDLKDFRNHILAHNYRIKGSSVYQLEEPKLYKKPHTDGEIKLLEKILEIILNNIVTEFGPEITELDYETLVTKVKFDYPEIDLEKELVEINEAIAEIKSNLD